MNLLAISAHPDDIEYGCARTLLKLKAQMDAKVKVLLLSQHPADPRIHR